MWKFSKDPKVATEAGASCRWLRLEQINAEPGWQARQAVGNLGTGKTIT